MALILGQGCGASPGPVSSQVAGPVEPNRSPNSTLLTVIDLEPLLGEAAHELSGSVYHPSTRTLHLLSQSSLTLSCLTVSPDLRRFSPCAPLTLRSQAASIRWDAEALTLHGDQFYAVLEESLPLLERFGSDGRSLGLLSPPELFRSATPTADSVFVPNKGLESLAVSPSGRYLFFANEFALEGDFSAPHAGTTVRVLRRDQHSGEELACAYRSQPYAGGSSGFGISEILALSDTELLVMERDWLRGSGNVVQLFITAIETEAREPCGPEVLTRTPLGELAPVLKSTLVLDLASLPHGEVVHPGVQRNPLLDNYEALALGPLLPDGRRVVFVISDDNRRSTQVARMLVLRLELGTALP